VKQTIKLSFCAAVAIIIAAFIGNDGTALLVGTFAIPTGLYLATREN